MSLSQDNVDQAALTGLLVFAGSVGTLATAGIALAVVRLAADTAVAIAAAGPAGIGITLALRKGK